VRNVHLGIALSVVSLFAVSYSSAQYTPNPYPYGKPATTVPANRPSIYESPSVQHVDGYERKNGTYVAPYDRTAPDQTKLNNWSTKGNVNPETGKSGTVNPYKPYKPYKY
jgi:hypothetical protein